MINTNPYLQVSCRRSKYEKLTEGVGGKFARNHKTNKKKQSAKPVEQAHFSQTAHSKAAVVTCHPFCGNPLWRKKQNAHLSRHQGMLFFTRDLVSECFQGFPHDMGRASGKFRSLGQRMWPKPPWWVTFIRILALTHFKKKCLYKWFPSLTPRIYNGKHLVVWYLGSENRKHLQT